MRASNLASFFSSSSSWSNTAVQKAPAAHLRTKKKTTPRTVTKKTVGDKSKENDRFFRPRTLRQQEYYDLLNLPISPAFDSGSGANIVVVTGPAGTAKTMGATLVGLEKLVKGEVDRLVLSRPAVSADEELGFLPGTLEDKMRVWLNPVLDSLRLCLKDEAIEALMSSSSVEVCSLSHMRGRTFRKSFVIVDECQNTTPAQMLMLMTRIGEGSRFVMTGDPHQHDLAKMTDRHGDSRTAKTSLADFVERHAELGEVAKTLVRLFEFEKDDVQRHPVIPLVLDMYDDT